MVVRLVPSPRTRRDLKRVSKKLRRTGNPASIRIRLTRGLRSAVRPALQRVKSEALSLPARGGQSKNKLRQQIARATRMQVRTSRQPEVNIVVPKKHMETSQQNLPKLTNRGQWRHPVFGGDVWVVQESRKGWFDNTLKKERPLVHLKIKRVINKIERDVS